MNRSLLAFIVLAVALLPCLYSRISNTKAKILQRHLSLTAVHGEHEIGNENGATYFIGDIHGDDKFLTKILKATGYADENGVPKRGPTGTKLAFTGDIFDRYPGEFAAFKLVQKVLYANPGQAFMTLGNHETMRVLGVHRDSPMDRTGTKFNEKARDVVKTLPILQKVDRYLFMHGGISSKWLKKIKSGMESVLKAESSAATPTASEKARAAIKWVNDEAAKEFARYDEAGKATGISCISCDVDPQKQTQVAQNIMSQSVLMADPTDPHCETENAGIQWYRVWSNSGLPVDAEPPTTKQMQNILEVKELFDVDAIIVGHTIQMKERPKEEKPMKEESTKEDEEPAKKKQRTKEEEQPTKNQSPPPKEVVDAALIPKFYCNVFAIDMAMSEFYRKHVFSGPRGYLRLQPNQRPQYIDLDKEKPVTIDLGCRELPNFTPDVPESSLFSKMWKTLSS